MESRAGIRDLKAHLSRYLEGVKKGATVLITEHGKPVARIVPLRESPEEKVAALADAGVVSWNGHRLGDVRPVSAATDTPDVATLLIEDRG